MPGGIFVIVKKSGYVPPEGKSVDFQFDESYTPPENDDVDFDFDTK